MALLGIVTSFIGAFFSKYLGKMLDEKGLKYTMIFEGGYLLVVIAALAQRRVPLKEAVSAVTVSGFFCLLPVHTGLSAGAV